MQILKNLFQVGGILNGITWDTQDASYTDCNTYVLKTNADLILFDCGCGDTLDQISQVHLFTMSAFWDMVSGTDNGDMAYCLNQPLYWKRSNRRKMIKA